MPESRSSPRRPSPPGFVPSNRARACRQKASPAWSQPQAPGSPADTHLRPPGPGTGLPPVRLPRNASRASAHFDLPDRLRARAADFAWRDSARWDAAPRPSRFKAALVARERLAEGFPAAWLRPLAESRAAWARVRAETLPLGGGSLTPARRAFERPMAMACLVDRAPCLPSRICSTSSRTNSPAWVVGAFPSRASRRARWMVFFSGIPSRQQQPPCHGEVFHAVSPCLAGISARPLAALDPQPGRLNN